MGPEPAENAQLLTIPHAAKSLGVGARILREAIKVGQVRAVELGQRQLISRKEIERIISSQSEKK